ncbi:MAG: TonB-dependent receptor [Aquabacterium sp.]|nr:TonB-dependent receptor [Aquabacterium sp.]
MNMIGPYWLAALAAGLPLHALAQATAAEPQSVVVSGSVQPRAVDDAPYAIDVVPREVVRAAGPMINLSEGLARVPGLVVSNRSNYAQDLQINIRGFGARAGFGVRGIRLVEDGVPAAGPDGQGQVSHFDLAGAQRIEVLRGPYSVLYGNSSGGVIALFTAPAARTGGEVEVDAGSFGLRQLRLTAQSPLAGGWEVRASAAQMQIDGFRPHSAADKRQLQLRLGWRGERDRWTLRINDLDQPAQDPLGLTRAQFDQDARQTTPQALEFDTRKTTRQSQMGLAWQHRFDGGPLRESQLAAYAGVRDVTQYLAIAAATQGNPRHGGGVVDFTRGYGGMDARLRWAWPGVDVVAGLAIDDQRDDRRGYENYTGADSQRVLGQIGRQRRDEVDRARSVDGYAQAEVALGENWHLHAGLRAGRIELSADDHYLSNGDDSGVLRLHASQPVLGLRWSLAPGVQAHAALARGFESPTLGELAYRVDGTGGFNTALQPQRSTQAEAGVKAAGSGWDARLALFEVRTSDEIGVATNAGGRSAFQNVGRTLRRGAEAGAGWRSGAWQAQVALGTLHAVYRDTFKVCAGLPCNAPTAVVAAGNRVAGAPRGTLFTALSWQGGAWGDWALEARGVGRTAVNDRNTDAAAGYAVAALRASRSWALMSGLDLEVLARVDNLFDRHHAGSLIVNDANGRFFEPGAPRQGLLALRLVARM